MISASCTSAGMRVSSSIGGDRRRLHGGHDRAEDTSARVVGPSASSLRVIPAVPNGLLRGPEVPCTNNVESSEIAAAKCSDTHDLAVPGTPSSSSARSVAKVATATSINRREPTYFDEITVPSGSTSPIRYVTTAQGDSRQWGGRGRSSIARSAANSA